MHLRYQHSNMNNTRKTAFLALITGVIIAAISCGETSTAPQKTDTPFAMADSLLPAATAADTALTPPRNASTQEYVQLIIAKKEALTKQLMQADSLTANQLYTRFRQTIDSLLAPIETNEQPWLDQFYLYGNHEGGQPTPDSVSRTIALLKTAGIEPWDIGEGISVMRTEPYFYTRLFNQSVTADYRQYIQLLADEDTTLFQADAAISIPLPDVAARVLNWEHFVKNYRSSPLHNDAKDQYEQYLQAYLFGYDNTPVFDNDKASSMYPENRQEFDRLLQAAPGTVTAQLVSALLLHTGQQQLTEDVKKKMEPVIEKALKGL